MLERSFVGAGELKRAEGLESEDQSSSPCASHYLCDFEQQNPHQCAYLWPLPSLLSSSLCRCIAFWQLKSSLPPVILVLCNKERSRNGSRSLPSYMGVGELFGENMRATYACVFFFGLLSNQL